MSQSVISDKYEGQKVKLQQLIVGNKKLFLDNKNLNSLVETLNEKQSTGKDQHNQLIQYLGTLWMVEVARIPYQ